LDLRIDVSVHLERTVVERFRQNWAVSPCFVLAVLGIVWIIDDTDALKPGK